MPQPINLKALFFDIDGVLVDVSRSYRRAIEETVGHFTGRQIVPGTVQRYKNQGGFNDDWKLTHAIITDTSMNVPLSRVIDEFQRRYRGAHWDGFIAEEPALIRTRVLDKLASRGAVMGVITGRPEAEAEWTLDRFGWKRYFPLVVAKEKQEGREKPHPFPLQHALAILAAVGRRTRPEEALYIGDSVDDMEAARAAGFYALGVVPPYVEREAHARLLRARGAHLVIDDPNKLPDVIEHFGERTAEVALHAE